MNELKQQHILRKLCEIGHINDKGASPNETTLYHSPL